MPKRLPKLTPEAVERDNRRSTLRQRIIISVSGNRSVRHRNDLCR